jgi:dienelactone hydrolase
VAGCAFGAGPAGATPPKTFDPVLEAENYAVTLERQQIYDTPQYQAALTADQIQSGEAALATEIADPERFYSDDLCWNLWNGCAGDIRLYNWGSDGYGLVRPVLFTARDGATISGHVWATVAGPARRPGIVITNGSVQADEQMYWYAAQTLAKEGYVVLTFDPQGQGQSDTFGEGADRLEGVPAQSTGTPFYDGTEDAINFFLSTPQHPYEPVPSCTTGTSHAAKQNRRVSAGLDAAYNPFWSLLQPSELGLAGHSYGAAGVSYVGQWDPRVKAIVAWDNLGSTTASSRIAGCPHDPAARRTVPITKPALGISADYFLPPTPNTSLPNPLAKSTWSLAYSKAGVDTGELIIRGGSHLDFSFIPNQAFGASYYGPDVIDWYTTAWFDKYLKRTGAAADRMLLTQRWRAFAPEAAIDPRHDANAFSFYYYSRLAFHLTGGRAYDCEDLRDGCPGLVPESADGYSGRYSYIKIDTTPDSVSGGGGSLRSTSRGGGGGAVVGACSARARTVVRLRRWRDRPITRAIVYLDGRRLLVRRGRALRSVTVPGLPGRARHRVRVVEYAGHHHARTIRRTIYGCARGA